MVFACRDDERSPLASAPCEATDRMTAPARELAQRLNGTDEILLLWHSEDDRVEVSVRDLTTGVGFHLEVEPAKAIDAFTHPYAYVARREIVDCVIGDVAAPVDG